MTGNMMGQYRSSMSWHITRGQEKFIYTKMYMYTVYIYIVNLITCKVTKHSVNTKGILLTISKAENSFNIMCILFEIYF